MRKIGLVVIALSCILCLSVNAAGKTVEMKSAAWIFLPQTSSPISEDTYKCVDLLYIGPFAVVDVNKEFGGKNLYSFAIRSTDSRHEKDSEAWYLYFKKIVAAAKTANPDIKIIASQWWNPEWGNPLSTLPNNTDAIDSYAESVTNLLNNGITYNGKTYSIDGYDIDYETAPSGATNVVSYVADVVSSIKSKLNSGKLITVSPADLQYLTKDFLAKVDYVNMQSYAGGSGIGINAYTVDRGVPASHIFYGALTEEDIPDGPWSKEDKEKYINYSKGKIDTAFGEADDNNLRGVHNWRLNSGNYFAEQAAQKYLYDKIQDNDKIQAEIKVQENNKNEQRL